LLLVEWGPKYACVVNSVNLHVEFPDTVILTVADELRVAV